MSVLAYRMDRDTLSVRGGQINIRAKGTVCESPARDDILCKDHGDNMLAGFDAA